MLLINYMNKNLKILLFVVIAIIVVAGFFCLSFKVMKDGNYILKEPKIEGEVKEGQVIDVFDPSVMTLDEKLQFNIPPSAKVEVWKRDDAGAILVYKQITDEDYQAKMAQIENNAKYDKNRDGVEVEILNDEDEYNLGLLHLGVYELLARNENGSISAYRYLRTDAEKELSLEWLNEEEKDAFGINPAQRVQLLKRGESGKIIAYKIINNDSDILTHY